MDLFTSCSRSVATVWLIRMRSMDDNWPLGRAKRALTKPLRETLVIQFTACGSGDGLCAYLIIFNELIATSLNQRGRLLMDESVAAMVRAGECRLNRMLADDPWSPAMSKCFLMAANRVGPDDAVVPPADLPAPPRLSDVSPRLP